MRWIVHQPVEGSFFSFLVSSNDYEYFPFEAGSPSEENSLNSAQSWSAAIQAALMPVTPQSSIGGQKRANDMAKLKVPNEGQSD
ncbi:hypothetical protein COOONC_24444 [Cooperia oncophora]